MKWSHHVSCRAYFYCNCKALTPARYYNFQPPFTDKNCKTIYMCTEMLLQFVPIVLRPMLASNTRNAFLFQIVPGRGHLILDSLVPHKTRTNVAPDSRTHGVEYSTDNVQHSILPYGIYLQFSIQP